MPADLMLQIRQVPEVSAHFFSLLMGSIFSPFAVQSCTKVLQCDAMRG